MTPKEEKLALDIFGLLMDQNSALGKKSDFSLPIFSSNTLRGLNMFL